MFKKEKLNAEEIEIRMLLESIYLMYGYDFRGYAKSSLRRRLLHRLQESSLASISEIQHRVLSDVKFFDTLLRDLSINVTEMFRDPAFYLAVRNSVMPNLSKIGHVKAWCAGCATGEEVYSIAILLKELGFYNRSLIFATDINKVVLHKASLGIYPISRMQEYSKNYQESGGEKSFADYFSADNQSVLMHKSLKTNLVFSDHNLATDSAFGKMDLIVCRNVLIYFGKELQNRVFKLFYESLNTGGYLCLGSSESAQFNDYADGFREISRQEKIYQKIGDSDAQFQTKES
jgi:chemotaxis protein methyltransferase CheR